VFADLSLFDDAQLEEGYEVILALKNHWHKLHLTFKTKLKDELKNKFQEYQNLHLLSNFVTHFYLPCS
jgi:hypothetical protein